MDRSTSGLAKGAGTRAHCRPRGTSTRIVVTGSGANPGGRGAPTPARLRARRKVTSKPRTKGSTSSSGSSSNAARQLSGTRPRCCPRAELRRRSRSPRSRLDHELAARRARMSRVERASRRSATAGLRRLRAGPALEIRLRGGLLGRQCARQDSGAEVRAGPRLEQALQAAIFARGPWVTGNGRRSVPRRAAPRAEVEFERVARVTGALERRKYAARAGPTDFGRSVSPAIQRDAETDQALSSSIFWDEV